MQKHMEHPKKITRSSKRLQSSPIRNIGVHECDNQDLCLEASIEKSKSTGKRTKRPQPLHSDSPLVDEENIQESNLYDSPLPDDTPEENKHNNEDNNLEVKRKKRGITKLKGLGIRDAYCASIDVDFNEKGQPIGDNSIKLASFIGALVRDKVSILYDDWRKVPKDHKENLWALVLLRYNLDDIHKDYILQKMSNSLREYRCHVGNNVVNAQQLDEEEKSKKLAELKPLNLSDHEWSEYIKNRISVKFQAKSVLMKQVREKHTQPHTMSRQGYARLEQKLKKEKPDQEISRVLLWTEGRLTKDRNPTNKAVEESMKKIQQFNNLQSKNSRLSLKDDALSNVLGEDRPGKVKGLGFGVTMSKLKAQAHSNKVVLALEENMRTLEAKVDLLLQSNHQVDNAHSHEFDNSKSKQSNDAENHASYDKVGMVDSHDPEIGTKCKLISWYKKGEVVAEGVIFSTDPSVLVHFKPLGLDAWKVSIDYARDEEAYLWQSTDEFKVVGDAVGSTVAWSKEFITLDLS